MKPTLTKIAEKFEKPLRKIGRIPLTTIDTCILFILYAIII